MSAQPTERTDLDTIEALDFDPPCEHEMHAAEPTVHAGPAYALVVVTRHCPACPDATVERYYCEPYVRALARAHRFRCAKCRAWATHTVHIVAMVRP